MKVITARPMVAAVNETFVRAFFPNEAPLLAILVLLVVMNWFFHKLYWTGWISLHNQRKRELMGRVKR